MGQDHLHKPKAPPRQPSHSHSQRLDMPSRHRHRRIKKQKSSRGPSLETLLPPSPRTPAPRSNGRGSLRRCRSPASDALARLKTLPGLGGRADGEMRARERGEESQAALPFPPLVMLKKGLVLGLGLVQRILDSPSARDRPCMAPACAAARSERCRADGHLLRTFQWECSAPRLAERTPLTPFVRIMRVRGYYLWDRVGAGQLPSFAVKVGVSWCPSHFYCMLLVGHVRRLFLSGPAARGCGFSPPRAVSEQDPCCRGHPQCSAPSSETNISTRGEASKNPLLPPLTPASNDVVSHTQPHSQVHDRPRSLRDKELPLLCSKHSMRHWRRQPIQ